MREGTRADALVSATESAQPWDHGAPASPAPWSVCPRYPRVRGITKITEQLVTKMPRCRIVGHPSEGRW